MKLILLLLKADRLFFLIKRFDITVLIRIILGREHYRKSTCLQKYYQVNEHLFPVIDITLIAENHVIRKIFFFILNSMEFCQFIDVHHP